jgi:hypothetical protein
MMQDLEAYPFYEDFVRYERDEICERTTAIKSLLLEYGETTTPTESEE